MTIGQEGEVSSGLEREQPSPALPWWSVMGSDHLVWAWGEPLASIRRNFTLGSRGGMSLRASTVLGRVPTAARPQTAVLGHAVRFSQV